MADLLNYFLSYSVLTPALRAKQPERKLSWLPETCTNVFVGRNLVEQRKNSIRFPKFGFMQVQVEIAFDQLLKAVRKLPAGQLRQLKGEIEKEGKDEKSKIGLEALLLNGPTATKKQLETIENNRKAINQWRTK